MARVLPAIDGLAPRCLPWPRCHVSAAKVRSHSEADNNFTWAHIHRLHNGTEMEAVEPAGAPRVNLSLAKRTIGQLSAWLSGPRGSFAAWDEAVPAAARRKSIQSVLDTIAASGSWINGSWDLLMPLSDLSGQSMWRVLANRTIVFMGDSQIRGLWDEFSRWYAAYGTRWTTVKVRQCGEEGSGCKNCFTCCSKGCPAGPHSRDHIDYTAYHEASNLTVDFSWKPEIFDPLDLVVFEQRLCRRPPDLLVVSKGLHGSTFYEFSDEIEWRRTYEADLHRWLPLLRCLQDTQIIWRSPDLPTRQPREAALMLLSESVVRWAFRDDEFGSNSYLVDALALTNAVRATSEKSLVASVDGHHYPQAVLRAEWLMLFLAHVLHTMGTGR